MSRTLAQSTATPPATRTLALVSLLGEDESRGSAYRAFGGATVLSKTLEGVSIADELDALTILAWDDQLDAIRAAAPSASVRSAGPRRPSRLLAETAAALRWADGWRGALLGRTTFDAGFDAALTLAALDDAACDVVALIDPAAALLDAGVIDQLVAHLATLPDQGYAFAAGPAGSGAIALRRSAIAELLKRKQGPGSFTAYHPDRPEHDPMAKSFAIVVPSRVARSSARLAVDSTRQARRLSLVQRSDAETMIEQLGASHAIDTLPRDVTLELTTRRATKPAWSILSTTPIERPDLSLDVARSMFAQLAKFDDVRLTFGGVGDPLLHPHWRGIVSAAREEGIRALHLETDLLADSATMSALAASELDIVSFHLPAAHATTYARLMGVDRMRDVLENVKAFLGARAARSSGVPIPVPTFVKCADNLGEMEAWYDQWIRAVGAAVIAGPSDLSGRIDYAGVADMTAGRRRPCRRLRSRLTILCDGSIASCEEDVFGEQRCGSADAVGVAWIDGLAMLRSVHDEHRWDETKLCGSCRMWDRP